MQVTFSSTPLAARLVRVSGHQPRNKVLCRQSAIQIWLVVIHCDPDTQLSQSGDRNGSSAVPWHFLGILDCTPDSPVACQCSSVCSVSVSIAHRRQTLASDACVWLCSRKLPSAIVFPLISGPAVSGTDGGFSSLQAIPAVDWNAVL